MSSIGLAPAVWASPESSLRAIQTNHGLSDRLRSSHQLVPMNCRTALIHLGMARGTTVPSIDLDASFLDGLDAAIVAPVAVRGAVEAAVTFVVWRATRPGWTQAGWWAADLRGEVRELLWLPLGLELQQRLVAIAAADRAAGYGRGECLHLHTAPSIEERVGVPGHPCACQVVTVAA